MFIGSKYSKQRMFHYEDCRFAKRTKEENRLVFKSIDDAKAHGFSLCPHCCKIGRQYANNRKAIDAFCDKNNFKHFIHDGSLYIVSAGDTAWRIMFPLEGRNKVLLHESKGNVPYSRRATPYVDREYHLQKTPSTSILGYLAYILDHDAYEKERNKKRELEKALRKEEIKSIRATQRQINRQNKKHRKNSHTQTHGQKRHRANQQLRALAASFSNYRSAAAVML